MLLGRNPFERLITTQIPVTRDALGGSFVYDLRAGPLTLPRTDSSILWRSRWARVVG